MQNFGQESGILKLSTGSGMFREAAASPFRPISPHFQMPSFRTCEILPAQVRTSHKGEGPDRAEWGKIFRNNRTH